MFGVAGCAAANVGTAGAPSRGNAVGWGAGLLIDAETTVGLTGVRWGAATGSGGANGTVPLTGPLTDPGVADTVPDVRGDAGKGPDEPGANALRVRLPTGDDAAVAGTMGEPDGADAGQARATGADAAALAWGQGKPATR